MSGFNSLEFNALLFGEDSPTSLSPFNYVNLQTNISGNSDISISMKRIFKLNADLNCTSTVEFIRMRQLKGFSRTVFSGRSTVTSFARKTSKLITEINAGSSSRAGTFLYAFDVHGITSTTDTGINVDYVFNDTIFSGKSTLIPTAHTIYRTSTDISGKTIILPTVHVRKLFSTNVISGSSSLTVNGLDVFSRLLLDETGISCNTNITAGMTKITGLKNVIIRGKTSFSKARMSVTYGGFGTTLFSGSSNFKSIKKLGSLESISGRTRIEATLTSPESLKNIGSRRRISFVFEVDKPDTKSGIIDQHYKILKFYNSLSSLPETLEYVRRNAQREIFGYDFDSTSHRIWSNGTYLGEGDLLNVKTGERGIVKKNATGIFIGKDGQFGIYTGPTIVNGEIV